MELIFVVVGRGTVLVGVFTERLPDDNISIDASIAVISWMRWRLPLFSADPPDRWIAGFVLLFFGVERWVCVAFS